MPCSVLPLSVKKPRTAAWLPLHVSQMGLPAPDDVWSFDWSVAMYQGSYYIISTTTRSTNNHFSSILPQALLLETGHLWSTHKNRLLSEKINELFDTGDGDLSHSETLHYKWGLITSSSWFPVSCQPRCHQPSHVKRKIAFTEGLLRLWSRGPQTWTALTTFSKAVWDAGCSVAYV
jgi:hypothetical protein